ncbi:Methionyl-tRNA formyltransferase [Blastocladiella emersonii ATCC 22665]|nr:Methionyl-tRNA formyltransferase [Blastocladiella emersonii ATCC 22665]
MNSIATRRRLLNAATATRFPRLRAYHVAFFGSDDFSARVLGNLLDAAPPGSAPLDSVTVVTPPPRARGRGLAVTPGALESFADARGLPVVYAPSKSLKPWIANPPAGLNCDLAVVVSFPYFLPRAVLERFSTGAVNLHPSLLPKYRGAAPIQHAILNGDTETGVSIIGLDPRRFDSGAVLAQRKVAIPNPDKITYSTLAPRLADEGSIALLDTLRNFDAFSRAAKTQDESLVTHARKLAKRDGPVAWSDESAHAVFRRWRAIAHQVPLTTFGPTGDPVQLVTLVSPVPTPRPDAVPGQLLGIGDGGVLLVAAADAAEFAVRVTHVKPANRGVTPAVAYVNGVGGPKALRRGVVRFGEVTKE